MFIYLDSIYNVNSFPATKLYTLLSILQTLTLFSIHSNLYAITILDIKKELFMIFKALVIFLPLILSAHAIADNCQTGDEKAKIIFEYAKKGYLECKKIGNEKRYTTLMGMKPTKVTTTSKQKWECLNSDNGKLESFVISSSFDGWCDNTSVELGEFSIFEGNYFNNLLK